MSLVSVLAALRQLLVRPQAFFEERPPSRSLGAAAGVVVATALLTTAGVGAIGRMVTARIDATRTETVHEPLPDYHCEMLEESGTNNTPRGCTIDEPVTREVDVGAEVWEEFVGYLPFVFVVAIVAWLLVAVGLHVASALAGGDGSFAATLAVAGWATVPELIQIPVGLAGAYVRLEGESFTSPEQLEQLVGSSADPTGVLLTAAVLIWQAYIWTHGLRRARDLSVDEAAFAAGVVAVVSFLLSLL